MFFVAACSWTDCIMKLAKSEFGSFCVFMYNQEGEVFLLS